MNASRQAAAAVTAILALAGTLSAVALHAWPHSDGPRQWVIPVVIHLAGLVALLAVLFLLRRATLRPMAGLAAQIEALGHGNFTERPQPCIDELDGLARQVNVAAVRLRVMVEKQNTRFEKLRSHVDVDELTGVSSRVHFMESLEQALRSEAGVGGGVALIRVNDLIGLNRQLGRDRVDEFIRGVATVLRVQLARVRVEAPDLARLNGADFGVLVPGIAQPDFERWLEGLAQALSTLQNQLVQVTVGRAWVGATRYRPGELLPLVMARADSMLQACEANQAALRFTSASNALPSIAAGDWRSILEQALDTGRVSLRLSAVRRPGGELVHRHATVQLTLPSAKVLGRAEIVPPAIRNARTIDIDLRVIELALEHIARTGEPVAVEVCLATLERPIFLNRLQEVLGRAGAHAAQLWIEVDESVLQLHADKLACLARTAASANARLGLKDVRSNLHLLAGTGRLPLHYVKLHPQLSEASDLQPGLRRLAEIALEVSRAEGLMVIAPAVADSDDRSSTAAELAAVG